MFRPRLNSMRSNNKSRSQAIGNRMTVIHYTTKGKSRKRLVKSTRWLSATEAGGRGLW